MALSPFEQEAERVVETDVESQPSKTYQLSTDSFRIGGLIDGDLAVKQFIAKAISTPRYLYPIYDDAYGSELGSLLGANITKELIEHEIPRLIEDALIYDDRIESVGNIQTNFKGDGVYVSLTVNTSEGSVISIINEEVVM